MIRVYLDWDVYSRIESSNTEYYPDLRKILLNNNKFLFPYSKAHIADIYESYLNVGLENIHITNHLATLNISKKIFLNHPFGESIGFYLEKPINALKNHIKALDTSITFDESTEKDSPGYIDYFPETTQFLKDYDEFAKTQDRIITSFQKLLETLLDENHKELYQKEMGISKGKLLNKNTNPIDFLDDNAKENGFSNFNDISSKSLNIITEEPNFIDELSSLFMMIDMSGFHEDKKTKTRWSTIRDSLHCAYGSTCDILIIDDKKSFYKSKETFKAKGILTKVFRPKDFIEYFEKYNLQFEKGTQFINFIHKYLESNDSKLIIKKEKIYRLNQYVLDYFNIISIEIDNESIIRFYKFSNNNELVLLPYEKEDLIIKITNLFGKPLTIHDSWNENGILNSAWLFNKQELFILRIENNHVVLSLQKLKEII